MDSLDAQILLALDDEPDSTGLALAGRLGIARNTLTARLQRLQQSGAIREFSRRVDPALLGRDLVAFVSIAVSQSTSSEVVAALERIPEIVEIHATTGEADLLIKIVARGTTDLHRLTDAVLAAPGVLRTSTAISLREEMPLRIRALIAEAAHAPSAATGRRTAGLPPVTVDRSVPQHPGQPAHRGRRRSTGDGGVRGHVETVEAPGPDV